MRKNWNKVFACMMTCCMMLGSFTLIKAASISMSASTSTVSPGGKFTVTIGGNVTGRVNVSVSNGSLSTSSCWVENNYATINVTAGSSGVVTVTATPIEGLSDENGDPADTSARSVSVSIKQPEKPVTKPSAPKPQPSEKPVEDNRSDNSNLSSLSVNEGTLKPEFSKNETEYQVTLPADATKIKLSAKAEDSKASVSGTGEKSVKAGKNEFSIVVTAEKGNTKTYKIIVHVDEKPLVFTKYGDKELGVVRTLDEVKVPSGFKEIKVKLDGKEVIAWKNEKMDKTIVYLSDSENHKDFYLLEGETITTKFTPRKFLGREIYLIDVPQELQNRKGMKFQEFTIDEVSLQGWIFDDPAFENYRLIYVMNKDGKAEYYQYETTQNTIQLYSEAAPVTQKEYEKKLESLEKEKMIWMYSCLGLVTIGVAGAIAFMIMKRKK